MWPGKRGKVYKETGGLCKIRNNALSHSDTAVSSSSYSSSQICVISCKDRKWLRLHSVKTTINNKNNEYFYE